MRDHIYKRQCHKLLLMSSATLAHSSVSKTAMLGYAKPTPSRVRPPLKYELSDKRQTEIIVTKIAPERKKYLDELAAMACYNEAKEMCPQYQAPSPWRLSNTLSDEVYTRLKKVGILAASERINVILMNLQTSTTIESST